jgi:hypothetical protein
MTIEPKPTIAWGDDGTRVFPPYALLDCPWTLRTWKKERLPRKIKKATAKQTILINSHHRKL